MRIIECMHTQSDCYKSNRSANPIGIIVHSTGANNTSIARYSQPSDNDPNRAALIGTIGTNKYGNHWNKSGVQKAVHYFIGKLADGSIGTVQNLPESIACWGCGKGKNGTYNYNPQAHIQFEICEDNLANADYFRAIYKEATELCADICRRHGWDASVIVSHREAHAKGYASNHSDINHWLDWYGKTMNGFRKSVQELLDEMNKPVEEPYTPAVGDVVNYIGTIHYSNANSTSPKDCKPGEATVTRTYKGKHPYHLINTAGDKDGVYGWVDGEYIKKLDKPAEKVEEPKAEVETPKVEVDEPKVEAETPTVEVEEPKVEVSSPAEETESPKKDPESFKEPPVETPLTQPMEPEMTGPIAAPSTANALKKLISWLVKIIKNIFSK